jgi:hypothetical protein
MRNLNSYQALLLSIADAKVDTNKTKSKLFDEKK